MLKATEDEIEEVREYFEWQAPDLEVTFNKDRWWVITGGTNLYSQEQSQVWTLL
jgi:hypothetical protein